MYKIREYISPYRWIIFNSQIIFITSVDDIGFSYLRWSYVNKVIKEYEFFQHLRYSSIKWLNSQNTIKYYNHKYNLIRESYKYHYILFNHKISSLDFNSKILTIASV